MKNFWLFVAWVSVARAFSLMGACTPNSTPPLPPPIPDASDAAVAHVEAGPASAVCTQACATMAGLGCSAGKTPTCPAAMTASEGMFMLPNGVPMTCAGCTLAKSQADVQNLCAASCSP